MGLRVHIVRNVDISKIVAYRLKWRRSHSGSVLAVWPTKWR